MKPRLHTMSIFEGSKVVVVRAEGCLALHIGDVTIHIYGDTPYEEAPVMVEMTEEEWSQERTRQIHEEVREECERDELHEVAF